MSPGLGAGGGFIIDLEDMMGESYVAMLGGTPAAERISEGGGGMVSAGDAEAVQPYGLSAVEMLTDQDAAAGIGCPIASRGISITRPPR